jgi:hypothetical protein
LQDVIDMEIDLKLAIDAHRDLLVLLASPSLPEDVRSAAKAAVVSLEKKQLGEMRFEVTPPGATIRVDAKRVEGPTWLSPGTHALTIEAPGYETIAHDEQVVAGEPTVVKERLRLKPIPPKAPNLEPFRWSLALMGLGVSALAAGGVLGVDAYVRGKQLAPFCPGNCQPAGSDLNDEGRIAARAADVTLACGAVLTAGGLGLSLWTWRRATKTPGDLPVRLHLGGAARPRAGVLSLDGRW